MPSNPFVPGYVLRLGSSIDRALLVNFMQCTYEELYPDQSFAHLAQTVDRYLCTETPLWWVDDVQTPQYPVACVWVGTAIDQVRGDRHAHIFLLYVRPAHRRRGLGTALMRHVETWATQRGDRQLGLQVFATNPPAIALYHQLGYQTQSFWMVKPLPS